MPEKKTVFLTGATGNMGGAGLRELLKKKDRFNIRVLARDSKANRKKLAFAANEPAVEILWGDLLNYNTVLKGVTGADYVLHVGGMVSPAADYYPRRTLKTNVEAARHIVKAVQAQPNRDDMRVVYIGTVAQTSDRNEPVHWGRTGDPICVSVYDHYAISKIAAEKIFAESGLKHWVSLRQSGILYAKILNNFDPIMFHVPLRGVLEWATIEDSGRLLANICDTELPDDFWRRFYNIGSGKEYRLTNYEFERYLLSTISCPRPEKIFNPEWFVLRNFHGQWYSDSDVLENYLHFRLNIPIERYFKENLGSQVPWYYHLARLCPPFIIKAALRSLANTPEYGTQWWIKHDIKDRVSAYYGSKAKWEAIPRKWKDVNVSRPAESEQVHISHGYDESKPRERWTLQDLRDAAGFRGGKCLAEHFAEGDFAAPVEWECAEGHRFRMSANLALLGGHWCPECTVPTPERMEWNYNRIAKENPFFAQIWIPLHGTDETDTYDAGIFANFKD